MKRSIFTMLFSDVRMAAAQWDGLSLEFSCLARVFSEGTFFVYIVYRPISKKDGEASKVTKWHNGNMYTPA